MVADPASKKPSTLPFPAIVGQPDLKKVLLLAAVHDDLSGALVAGEKGTAKSTAVRGLVDLLGDQQVVADCPYGCAPDDPAAQCVECQARPREEMPVEARPVPLVTLPLGATRDRVVGTLSIEEAMAGESEFDPGLLARANRGILYVDEINLLDDHLVDVLLDAAASGVNTVERDGISVSHPAEFTLIGTMNPEEGDLRPQLRDRFDLQATVEGSQDLGDRMTIIDRALGAVDDTSDADTDASGAYEAEVDQLRQQLQNARQAVDGVSLPEEFKRTIAELCIEANVDGHRADIATARAAMALAALDSRPKVLESDIQTAARYTLPHRLQSQPFEEPPDPDELLDDYFDDDEPDAEGENEQDADSEAGEGDENDGNAESNDPEDTPEGDDSADSEQSTADTDRDERDGNGERGSTPETNVDEEQRPTESEPTDTGGDAEATDEGGDADEEATPLVPGQQRAEIGDGRAPELDVDTQTKETDRAGRRGHVQSSGSRGTRIRTERTTGESGVDAAASVRAAAASGHDRVERDDLRQSVRQRETAATIVFAVDASASMRPAMETAKGVLLALLREAYEQRDQVAFVAFGGDEAEVVLPPTRSLSLAARHLKELPTGDRTPLPDGLRTAHQVLDASDAECGVVVLVTDGRATVADSSPTQETRQAARRLAASGASVVIVDAADRRNGLIPLILDETSGTRVDLSALSSELVATAVERATRAQK